MAAIHAHHPQAAVLLSLLTRLLPHAPAFFLAQVLAPGSETININDQIMAMYLDHLLPEITQPGDDMNYGSCAMDDVMVLQVRPGGCTRGHAVVCFACWP